MNLKIQPNAVDHIRNWLATRHGVAVWKSVNLSNPSGQWLTPATIRLSECDGSPPLEPVLLCPQCGQPAEQTTPETKTCPRCAGRTATRLDALVRYPKPNWQCSQAPDVITNPSEVAVVSSKVWKRLRVGLRKGSNGLSLKLTDASTKKVRALVEKCEQATGKLSFFEFDYGTQEAVILFEDSVVTLDKYTP